MSDEIRLLESDGDHIGFAIEELTPEELQNHVNELGKQLGDVNGSEIIASIIKIYNEKYSENFQIDSVKEFLDTLPNMSTNEFHYIELIGKDISTKLLQVVKIKAIITNALLIDRCLDLVKLKSASPSLTDGVLVTLISRIFEWISVLDDMLAENNIDSINIRLNRIHKEKGKELKPGLTQDEIQTILDKLVRSK